MLGYSFKPSKFHPYVIPVTLYTFYTFHAFCIFHAFSMLSNMVLVQELGEPPFHHFFVKKVVTLAMDKNDR